MQEAFLVRLLSMRAFHELHNGHDSDTVHAIDVVIDAFTKRFTEWESEKSVAYGGVQTIRELRLTSSAEQIVNPNE
jgi:hypothetical protein